MRAQISQKALRRNLKIRCRIKADSFMGYWCCLAGQDPIKQAKEAGQAHGLGGKERAVTV
jgi:hypothetical protein